MKKTLFWTAIGASFLWMAFVYASFYLVPAQRPLDAGHLRAIGGTLLNLLAAAWLLLVALGCGRRICRWLGLSLSTPLEQWVLGAGVGLGALSLLVLALGLAGGLARWALALLLGALTFATLPDLLAAGRALCHLRRGSAPRWPLALYLGATLLLALALALAPPIDWDGLFYHLTFPRLYIEQHKIAPLTDVPHQFYPGLVEQLYLAAMLLRGDVAAKLLHTAYALLLAGMVYLLAQQHLGRAHAWPAVALYAATPMVALLAGWAYTDLALAFYQLAALYALLRWMQEPRLPWVALAGLLCGLAMGVKYTSLLCPLYLLLLAAAHLVRARIPHLLRARIPRRRALAALGLLAGLSALVAAPWYARNLAWTGNPVYPFAYRWLGASPGIAWDGWRAAWYARAGSGLGGDMLAWLKLPWTLTLGLRDVNFYDGRVGPLYLLALPFLVAWGARLFGQPWPRPPAAKALIGFALLQYGAWMAGVVRSQSLFQSRLLLSACVALCPPIAYVYGELRTLDRPRFSLQQLIRLSVALVLAANLCAQCLYTLNRRPLPVLVGAESRDDYLARNLGAHYAAMQLVNESVSPSERVLFLWEPRSYYSRVPTEPDAILDRWPWLVSRHDGAPPAVAAAVAGELREQGYSFVLYHRAGAELVRRARLDPLTKQDWKALDAFLDGCLVERARVGDAYVLYALP
jgi:hypothetical protein